jgi:hypothetical protein
MDSRTWLVTLAALLALSSSGCATMAGTGLGLMACGGNSVCTNELARLGAQGDEALYSHIESDVEAQRVRAAETREPSYVGQYRCRDPQRRGVSTISRSEREARRVCGGDACVCERIPEAS